MSASRTLHYRAVALHGYASFVVAQSSDSRAQSMKTTYYIKQNNPPPLAVLDLVPGLIEPYKQGNAVSMVITRLNVPNSMRGQGVAKALLSEVCSAADAENAFLCLEFSPYPNTDPKRLSSLYKSFGFEACAHPQLLVRKPKSRRVSDKFRKYFDHFNKHGWEEACPREDSWSFVKKGRRITLNWRTGQVSLSRCSRDHWALWG